MSELSFRQYMQIGDPESERSFQARMEAAGYFSFYKFAEDFRSELKSYSDADVRAIALGLERGRRLFPSPGAFSPSWNELWDEFEGVFARKNDALAAIPASEREGEWQVLIDNPFVPQQVVCYPSLGFLEAAYMYGYFQRELKPHENLRLQKVALLLSTQGDKKASFFPTT